MQRNLELTLSFCPYQANEELIRQRIRQIIQNMESKLHQHTTLSLT